MKLYLGLSHLDTVNAVEKGYQHPIHKARLSPYFATLDAFSIAVELYEGKCGIIEIETSRLDQNQLLPDPEVVAQWRERHGTILTTWAQTVVRGGYCIYLGFIPTLAITRAAFMDYDICLPLVLPSVDSKISVTNFELMYPRYGALTSWIFDWENFPKIETGGQFDFPKAKAAERITIYHGIDISDEDDPPTSIKPEGFEGENI